MLALRHRPEKKRIKQGVALLNENHCPDWVGQINPDTLNIDKVGYCILGQLHDHFDVGMMKEGLVTYGDAHAHGFYDLTGRYEILTKEWVKFIKKEQLARSA